jgi:hypothetical protein
MEVMILKPSKKGSRDLDSFGGRLGDARKEAGMTGIHACNNLNGYLLELSLGAVNINTFRSWERIGTSREMTGKSYPHPNVYAVLSELYGVTGYWLFFGGDVERYRVNINTPASTNIALEQRKALSTEAHGHRRIEIQFRKMLLSATNSQKRAIELLINSILENGN